VNFRLDGCMVCGIARFGSCPRGVIGCSFDSVESFALLRSLIECTIGISIFQSCCVYVCSDVWFHVGIKHLHPEAMATSFRIGTVFQFPKIMIIFDASMKMIC